MTAELYAVVNRLVGPLGIVGRVRKMHSEFDDISSTSTFIASGCMLNQLHPDSRFYSNQASYTGYGTAEDEKFARAIAIVEAAERYAASILLDSECILTSAVKASSETLDWNFFPLLLVNEAECPEKPIAFDSKKIIRWSRGVSVKNRREILVPSCMVFINQELRDGERFCVPHTTGVAAHTDLRLACSNAIYELVERDAMEIVWRAKLRLPRVERIEEFVTDACLVYDATLDSEIPTYIALREFQVGRESYYKVACSSNLDPVQAILSAASEANLLVRNLAVRTLDLDNECSPTSLEFLLGSDLRTDVSIPVSGIGGSQEELSRILELAERFAQDLVLLDLTTDDLMVVGLHVVRAIAPSLVPISGESWRYSHTRLERFGKDARSCGINAGGQPFGK